MQQELAPVRPPLPTRRSAWDSGARAPTAQPALREESTAPRGPGLAPRTSQPGCRVTSSGTCGGAAPGRPPRGPSRRGAKHATPRGPAAQRPSPSRAGTLSPGRRGGALLPGPGERLSLGPARASSTPSCPHARQPAAFKSPGYSAGGESMRAGAARSGRGETGRRWGVPGGGPEGWGRSPREESAKSPSCLCSHDRDGQPPRGSQSALSLPRAVHRPFAARHPNI